MVAGSLIFDIEHEGKAKLRRLSRFFDRFRKDVVDLRPIFREFEKVFSQAMEKQFESEGAHLTGKKWAPLNTRYLIDKTKHGQDKILQRTGRLRSAAVNPKAKIEKRRLSLTISHPAAAWHQRGTRWMPVRSIIKVSPEMKRSLALAAKKDLDGKLKGGIRAV